MALYNDNQFNGYDGFDDFGFSLKKTFKKVTKGVKTAFRSPKAAFQTIGKAIAAPLVVPAAIGIKATTYALSKTKIKPFVKLEKAVGKVYRSPLIKSTRDIAAVELAIGAAVGGGILAAKAIAAGTAATAGAGAATSAAAPVAAAAAPAAAVGVGAGTVGTVGTIGAAAVAAAKEALIDKAIETGKDLAQTAATQLVGAGAPPEEVAAMSPEQQIAASTALGTQKTDAGVVGPAAGALIGFLVGGPVGAVVGGGAGYYATRKQK